ncbi:Hypothetical_protein [Hexamita inflata]|uniref:Hypothetical_protein n=1 Tax=Hexamita inflata TaxID=28002 RepID=A0AA86QDI7_9EUKA|nr:Hypothetical protein HINF_LOCUS40538 [Hexamita inflata]
MIIVLNDLGHAKSKIYLKVFTNNIRKTLEDMFRIQKEELKAKSRASTKMWYTIIYKSQDNANLTILHQILQQFLKRKHQLCSQVSNTLNFQFDLTQILQLIQMIIINIILIILLCQILEFHYNRAKISPVNQCSGLVTNALHEGTIATKQGQRDRQATGRRALRAPPGLLGARQEGEAQGNAGSDGLGVTVEN